MYALCDPVLKPSDTHARIGSHPSLAKQSDIHRPLRQFGHALAHVGIESSQALGTAVSRQSAEPVRLPAALLKPKIRALFELLDAARDLRRLASTGMNQQLALEALLLGGRTALAE